MLMVCIGIMRMSVSLARMKVLMSVPFARGHGIRVGVLVVFVVSVPVIMNQGLMNMHVLVTLG